jgi:hypothetical protein
LHVRRLKFPMWTALAGAIWVVAGLAGATAAAASNAGVAVTNSAGLSDPAAGVPRVFTISGKADRPGRVYVAYRAPGGGGCAPSASSDSGQRVGSYYGASVDRSFSFSETRTWSSAGTFVFCIWVASSETAITVPMTQTLTFRSPVGSIAAVLDPITPRFGEPATITVYGQSEAPARVFMKIRAVGEACATSFGADSGKALLSGTSVDGAFSLPASTTQAAAGPRQLCLWLATSGDDPTPIAGPVVQWLFVLAPPRPPGPPPPCLVPGVTRGIHLATMRKRILDANCTVGKVRYLRSRTVATRVIIRLSSRAGSKLRSGSPITIYVSTGRRAASAAGRSR